MAKEAETAPNGVYLDLKTNKVVRKQPEEGYQLVRPGGEITAEKQALIERFTADAETVQGERDEFHARIETATDRNVEHAAAVAEGVAQAEKPKAPVKKAK